MSENTTPSFPERSGGSESPRSLLEQYGITPRKSLGQSFLHDPGVLERIVEAADLSGSDTVLEIGPGTGALTRRLLERAGRVIAVEIDERLVELLEGELGDAPGLELIHADILETDASALVGSRPYKLVANLPYYITGAILRRFLETPPRPSVMVVTVQREVAERIMALPGKMSLLSVSVQLHGRASLIGKIGPGAFWPPPGVESAIVRIDISDTPCVEIVDEKVFFRVVRAGFGQKRKKLRNSLRAGLGLPQGVIDSALEAAGIDPARRPETLSVQEWAALARALSPG